jgi:hypothetical protein
VRECIAPDFLELDGFADQLTGYDACSYCAGASSRGISEAEYSHVTYDVTNALCPQPTPGQQNIKPYYKAIGWLYPLLPVLLPNQVSTMRELGLSMISSVLKGYPKQVVQIKDIKSLAKA